MTTYALLLVLASAALHAAWNTGAKGSGSPAAFVLGMDGVVLLILGPVLLAGGLPELPASVWVLLVTSGLVHAFYALFLTRAYETGDLSLVYPIARSTPAFVPLVSVPLFDEPISAAGGLGITIVVVSMWLVLTSGPAGSEFRWRELVRRLWSPGAVFSYLTLATTVAYSILDGRAMQELDGVAWTGPLPRSTSFLLLLSALYLPVFALLAGRRVRPAVLKSVWRAEGGRILIAALCGYTSYSLILEALRTTGVSYVVAVRQTSVVFAVLFGLLWLKERPSAGRLVGIAGTVTGVALIALAG